MDDTSTVGIANADILLTEAIAHCAQGEPSGIEIADILLKEMKGRNAIDELDDAGTLWLQAGYACLAQSDLSQQAIGWGNDTLRMAVRYLTAAGSNDRLIAVAKEQTDKNDRLALRAYASIAKEYTWKDDERDAALELAEKLQNELKSMEDVLRIRDAFLLLNERAALVRFADTLDKANRHLWAQAIYAVIDEEEVPA